VALLEAISMVMLVAILYLALLLQQVAVVVAKPPLTMAMAAPVAVATKEMQVVLVIRPALHHHKEIMVGLL
jgi:hypothetical protein